ncbi:MAG: hypothetical protein M4579_003603 [Chaenotheca gracillima]|nr:MAG: hypothetical protein M4579_003603 [Chaenotheca gracillima]
MPSSKSSINDSPSVPSEKSSSPNPGGETHPPQSGGASAPIAEKAADPANPPSEIPNGGFRAWLQCAAAFVLFFNCWGIINTFGAYQTYYERELLRNESSSNIAWIGSVQGSLLIFISVVTGPLYDYGYYRLLLWSGTFLVVFGMMMTSLCTSYWQIILAQGIVVGLGAGCLFMPSIAILPSYFSTKKAFAQGVAASGSSLGGVIYPILFHKLQPQIGFPWATRVIGFIALGTLTIPLVGMRMRVKPSSQRKLVDLTAWKEPPFTLFTIGEFFGFLGLYVPFFYVQIYAIENNIMSEDLAFYLVSILNAASIFGRIIPNFAADKTGPINMLIPCSLIASILAFAWIGIKSSAGLIVFCALYGFFSGTFVSLPPTVTYTLSPSLGVVGARLGMVFLPSSIGLLIGTPIAGAILKSGWPGLQAFCGVAVGISGLCIVAARIAKAGPKLLAKA